MTEHDPTTATEPTHHVDPLGGAAEQGRAMNNITEAGSFARERATELKQSVLEGNCGLRILVLVGALAMMTTSIIGLVSDVYHIDTIGALIDIYCFILAVMMIILEYGYQLSFFAAIQPSLYKNALFLKFVWGRGLFYFITGSLEISQRHYMNIIVGSYVCILGFAFAIIGRSASQKLAEARRSTFTPEDIRTKFRECDEEMKGSLDLNQFSSFVKLLGMDMNRREVETTFLQLEEEGRITLDAILEWWDTEATENFSVLPSNEYQHMA